jgi:hypothetical protein
MWRNWWPRRSAQANDEAASTPIDVATSISDAGAVAVEGNVSAASLDLLELPFSEFPGGDLYTDEAVTWPAVPTDADAALLFAVDDIGRLDAEEQDDSWWLPPPSRRSVIRVTDSARGVRSRTRRVDRIAMLDDLRGCFTPDCVADMLRAAA